MKIIEMNIEDLIPYKDNPRINYMAVDAVANSIREFGFKVPIIVDKNNVIIAGHTRLEASKRLGLEKVPVIIADDLTPEQVKAFRIMDNKSAQYSEWDYEKLLKEIDELAELNYDIDLTGFSQVELDEIITKIEKEQEKEKEKQEEEKPEVEFTEQLLEEHNYIVFYFDNTLDWQVAKEIFDIKTVKALGSKEGFEQKGIGRVVDGKKLLQLLEEQRVF